MASWGALIPGEDNTVVGAAHDAAPVGQCHGLNPAVAAAENERMGVRVAPGPYPYSPIATASGELMAIWREAERVYAGAVTRKLHGRQLAVAQIPYTHNPVRPGACQVISVGCKSDRKHGRGMSEQ